MFDPDEASTSVFTALLISSRSPQFTPSPPSPILKLCDFKDDRRAKFGRFGLAGSASVISEEAAGSTSVKGPLGMTPRW
jgi:hypothetical protein